MKIGWRIWLLIAVLLLSLLAISPSFNSGVIVTSVSSNSSALHEGIAVGQVVKSVNGVPIKTVEDYSKVISELFPSAEDKKVEIITNKADAILFTNQSPEITVGEMPSTKIKMGLDLQGGARALVQADHSLTDGELNDLISVSRNRFNVYGLSDIQIRGVSDLSGNKFMLLEVAGATPKDLEELVSKQGKFEAKIGNSSVFTGGKTDIADVCRNDATCAGITACNPSQDGYVCSFRFALYLTAQAAQRHADITSTMAVDSSGKYLAEKLYLYVDDQEMDSLLISTDLKGKVTTDISIQGSGSGRTQEEAVRSAQENMKKLQTILITGSLPYKLSIVKLDTISPALGKDFVNIILLAAVASIILVSIIIFARYRKFKISLALLFTAFSELIIILGLAALLKWNLDLPSIAGILATIGTGVDSQIVILDEARKNITVSSVERMKRALFIIFSSFFTAVVAMLPLISAGAGLFKGFALTTIAGITIGVLISRPAFAEMIREMDE
ncbi:MAG: hypothetical protein AABX66_01790 [Nanoarchaeota archaeon]